MNNYEKSITRIKKGTVGNRRALITLADIIRDIAKRVAELEEPPSKAEMLKRKTQEIAERKTKTDSSHD